MRHTKRISIVYHNCLELQIRKQPYWIPRSPPQAQNFHSSTGEWEVSCLSPFLGKALRVKVAAMFKVIAPSRDTQQAVIDRYKKGRPDIISNYSSSEIAETSALIYCRLDFLSAQYYFFHSITVLQLPRKVLQNKLLAHSLLFGVYFLGNLT